MSEVRVLHVDDDGVGLPEGGYGRVFEPGRSATENGTRFGLAIVRSIAEVHGWSVTTTEGTDGGARFEFSGVEIHEDVADAPEDGR